MAWHFTPYSVPLIIGAAVLIISAFLVLRRSPTLTNIYMVIVNILIAIFSGSYGMELAQTTVEGMFFWRKVGYLGGATSPVFLLLLIIAYNNSERWLTRFNHLILLAIPFLSIGLAWTSQYHELIWGNPKILQTGSLYVFEYDPGWWYWVAMIYAYLMVLLSVALLLTAFSKREGAFRKQVILFLVGILFPMLVFVFYSFSVALGLSLPKIEWHAYALIITGAMVTSSLLNTQIFQIGPVAYDAIFKNIEDVIIVLDNHNRVIEVNPTAFRVFHWERSAVIGTTLSNLFSTSEFEKLQPYLDGSDTQGEIILGNYYLELKITSFKHQLQREVGHLMVMRDITQRVEAENAMRELAALEERHRIASDLHDSMTQSLHSLVLSAETAQYLHRENQPDKLGKTLGVLEDSARQALREMRLLCYELQLTPEASIDWFGLLEARLESVEGRMGMDTILEFKNPDLISKNYQREVFYVVTEALNNSLRHSYADRIWVTIQSESDQVTAEVRDDGRGFILDEALNKGMGLQNIKERAVRLNGELVIDTAPGKGTAVIFEFDLG